MSFIRMAYIFTSVLNISLYAFSDSVDLDLIFSEDLFMGAANCSDIGADAYCEKPIPIYDSEGLPLNKNLKVLRACVVGGGDCAAVSFIFEIKELKRGIVIVKIRDESKKFVWIKIDKSSIKNIESLIPELGTGANHVEFRPNFSDIYSDKNLLNRLERSEMTKLPKGRKLDPEKEKIEYLVTNELTVNSKKVLEIKINLILLDLKALKDLNDLDAIEKGQRIELRKIYFPVKDDKGRISYWFLPQSC